LVSLQQAHRFLLAAFLKIQKKSCVATEIELLKAYNHQPGLLWQDKRQDMIL